MFFVDGLTLDAPRRTADGYMAVRARAARTGVYQYSGREVDPNDEHGLRDKAIVNVLRDENTVFDRAAAQSFIGKPVTDDHPRESVNSQNWSDLAKGMVMGALRDGEYLAFDLLLTDKSTIDKVDAGKRDLSNGYGAELAFGDFKAPDGTACDARQARITGGNHVAVVTDGRAGKQCAIADVALCDAAPSSILDSFNKEKPVSNFVLDGLTVNLGDATTATATVTTLRDQRDAARKEVTDLQTHVATLTTDKSTLDARVVTLEQQVKDAKPTTAQLRDAAKAYAITAGKAKQMGVTVTDAMDEPAIMKAVVDAKLGDAGKDWTDVQIAASFATMTKDLKVEAPDLLRDVISNQVANMDGIDPAADRAKRATVISDAWRQPAGGNA